MGDDWVKDLERLADKVSTDFFWECTDRSTAIPPQLTQFVLGALHRAVAAEREACAQVAQRFATNASDSAWEPAQAIVAAIRARSKP